MDDLTVNYREVLTKKPWWRVTPKGYMQHNVQVT